MFRPRRFTYHLLTALPLALAAAFGLGLWQTNGALLQWRELGTLVSFSNPLAVEAAQAACSTTANPAVAPGATNGALYYNSCANTFRAWLSNQWVSPFQWDIDSTGQQIKTLAPVALYLDPSTLGGTTGRDSIIFNVTTAAIGGSANNLVGLVANNVDQFGFWSKHLNSWATLIAGQYCLGPSNCITAWPQGAGGNTLWDYVSGDTLHVGPINNLNTSGNVEVTNELFVDRAITIQTTGLINPSTWTLDAPLPSPAGNTISLAGCTGTSWSAACGSINRVFFTADGSFGRAIGPGGQLLSKTNPGWTTSANPSASFGATAALWVDSSGNAYSIDPATTVGSCNGHKLMKFTAASSSWAYLGGTCSTSFVDANLSGINVSATVQHIYGLQPVASGVVRDPPRYFDTSNGSFNDLASGSFSSNVPGGGGVGTEVAVAVTSTSPERIFVVTSRGMTELDTPTATTWNGFALWPSGASITPTGVAIDSSFTTTCDACIMVWGHDDINTGTTKRVYFVKFDGSAYTMTANQILVANDANKDYNNINATPGVVFTDGWLGGGATHALLSGADSTGKFILIGERTAQGQAWVWNRYAPGTNSFAYAVAGYVSGSSAQYFAGQSYDNIYRSGPPTPAGTLKVGGEIIATGNKWGTNGESTCYDPNGNPVVPCPTSGAGGKCPSGYYVVAVYGGAVQCAQL